MLEPVDKEADSDWLARFGKSDKRNRTVSGSRKRTCDTHTDTGCLTKPGDTLCEWARWIFGFTAYQPMEDDSRHELSDDLNASNRREGVSFKGKQPHQPAVVTHPFVVCQPPINLTLCLLQGFHESRPLFWIGCWPHLFVVGLVIGPQRPTASRARLSSDQVCSHHSSPTTTDWGRLLPNRELWVKPGVAMVGWFCI